MKVEHPGKKIEALLKATGMSRRELAVRTTVTEKHINTLIAGEKKITTSYARKLGYVFDGMDAAAWQKLQNDYLKLPRSRKWPQALPRIACTICPATKIPFNLPPALGQRPF